MFDCWFLHLSICCLHACCGGQIALLKYLEEHNYDPAIGMAVEEAVNAKILTEAEAKELLERGSEGLKWGEMLQDAARNTRLQEFLKGNRWMLRQGFVDFEAKVKELAQQHRNDLSALEKAICDLEEEVKRCISSTSTCSISCALCSKPKL